jgi:hypothetical protein
MYVNVIILFCLINKVTEVLRRKCQMLCVWFVDVGSFIINLEWKEIIDNRSHLFCSTLTPCTHYKLFYEVDNTMFSRLQQYTLAVLHS